MKKLEILFPFYTLLLAAMIFSCSSAPKAENTEAITQSRSIALQLMEQGNKQYDQGNYAGAKQSFQSALNQYSGIDYSRGSILALLALGKTENLLGSQENALGYFRFALEISEKEKDSLQQRNVLNHLADFYLKKSDFEQALEYLNSPVDFETTQLDPVNSERLRILGTVEKKKQNYDQALDYFEQALSMDQNIYNRANMAADHYLIASIYSLQEKYSLALTALENALSMDKYIEYSPGVASDLTAMGVVASKQGDKESALYYFRRAYFAWKGLGRTIEMEELEDKIQELTGQSSLLP